MKISSFEELKDRMIKISNYEELKKAICNIEDYETLVLFSFSKKILSKEKKEREIFDKLYFGVIDIRSEKKVNSTMCDLLEEFEETEDGIKKRIKEYENVKIDSKESESDYC